MLNIVAQPTSRDDAVTAKIKLYLQPDTEPILTEVDLAAIVSGATDSEGNVDVYRTISEGWRVKAAKAAADVAYSTGETSERRDQIIAHCLRMAEHYSSRRGIISIPVSRADMYK